MAKIWPVFEGKEPTVGGHWVEMPLREVISLFELRHEDFVSDLEAAPKFGPQDRTYWHEGFRHIVAEVQPSEAQKEKWKPGFYRARATPNEAFFKLIEHALVGALGKENIVRVEHTTAVDSSGRDALKITVVIVEGAVKQLRGNKTLDALVALQTRLRQLKESRIPVLEYATEAELAQDANS